MNPPSVFESIVALIAEAFEREIQRTVKEQQITLCGASPDSTVTPIALSPEEMVFEIKLRVPLAATREEELRARARKLREDIKEIFEAAKEDWT